MAPVLCIKLENAHVKPRLDKDYGLHIDKPFNMMLVLQQSAITKLAHYLGTMDNVQFKKSASDTWGRFLPLLFNLQHLSTK